MRVYVHTHRRSGCLSVIGAFMVLGLVAALWRLAIPLLVIGALVYVGDHRSGRRAREARQALLRTRALTLKTVYDQGPENFEKYIVELLKSLGWREVRHLGRTGDLGADVIGYDTYGRKTVVQVKRYAPLATIGSPVIQALIGSQVIHKADRAMLVTTGKFTQPAMQLASAMDVELVDGRGLVAMVELAQGKREDA
jgi:restriction system protein